MGLVVSTLDNEGVCHPSLDVQLRNHQAVNVPCDTPADVACDCLIAFFAAGGTDLRVEFIVGWADYRGYGPRLDIAGSFLNCETNVT